MKYTLTFYRPYRKHDLLPLKRHSALLILDQLSDKLSINLADLPAVTYGDTMHVIIDKWPYIEDDLLLISKMFPAIYIEAEFDEQNTHSTYVVNNNRLDLEHLRNDPRVLIEDEKVPEPALVLPQIWNQS